MKKIFAIIMSLALSSFAGELCVVTFKIKQSTFTLSISEHFKNEANKQFLQIPVDCDFYNTLRIGQELHSEFKVGSFIFNGDLSKLEVTVHDKKKVNK
jgi:hypothetical protein